MLLKLFHLSVIVLYSYTIWYDQMYVEIPLPEYYASMPFKARHVFLTIWCLLLQTAYFTSSLLNDIFGTNEATPREASIIRKIKDTIFSLALPVAIYVTVMFWTIFTINKELIMPQRIYVLLPKWLNHVMHTAVTPIILIELFVTNRNYPPRKLGLYIIVTFMLLYSVWQHILYFKIGVWMYPFLDALNWPTRTMFYVVSASSTVCVYFLGEKINCLVTPRPAVFTNGINDVSKKKH